MSPLAGKTFVFELGRDIRFKAKQDLTNYLREQNANISYILTASTDYVLVSSDLDTYKTRRAKQLGIPLVNVEYIYECRKSSAVDIKQFLETSAEDKENFLKSGTLPVSGSTSSTNTSKPVKVDLSKIKIWNSDDVELPKFDELTHAEIAKWAIFKETNEHSDVYFALELQIIPEQYFNQTTNQYRLRFRYEKQTITVSQGKQSFIQYAFSADTHELHQLFALYYNRIATMPRITRIRDLLPDKLGSKLLLRSLFLHRIDTQMLDDNVCQLIESLWIESIGDLNKILSIAPESIALKTIIEAEAALLEIKSSSPSAAEAQARFYSLIPHRPSFHTDLLNHRRALVDKLDLCQMLRDLLTVNELTNWNIKASIEAKYRALKCHVETMRDDTQEYRTICEMIHSSTNSNEQVMIHQIYSVAKQTDALNFRSTLGNQKQLFHGSKYQNFLGILSRGLLMPKIVVNDLGITRTDIGCLGYGIYFSDSVSTSLKYTTPSESRSGRRLLCISQVALGESAKFYSYASNLTQAPDHFHSTYGVKKNQENNSKFIDDEYAIYSLDQQRLLYIIEVSWMPHDSINQSLRMLPLIRDYGTNQSVTSSDKVEIPSTIEDEVIQVAEQDYGLICPSSGELVPLKAFHIRAQIVDVTAEVVLYQVYHNTNAVPIEAKYVFPLDENCSVCGFEAHINNKVIKGVVKEKEQAKREYREAIEKGHGAYLMHQEQPEVFSVSVGNLPANCQVIIKITYVAELAIENNDIIFRLPAKVASWQSKQALDTKDQTILPSINLEQDNSSMKAVEFSLKTSLRMPYEISKLFSPTHRLRRKITDCIAMIELVDNILLEKDFILSITLKSVHLPRMLNETSSLVNDNSQACMLTFYPKFEVTNSSNEYLEMIFIIDVSNSMDGNHVQQAKQLAHLFLTSMKTNEGNIHFNIVTFGSDNDECFPISSPNTKENIDKAKHFILHSLDHRGNTDLFSVLRQYSLLPCLSKLGRQFLLLSDGHISDLKSILTLFQSQLSMRYDRLFTCSIGDTSNKYNLKQLTNGISGGGLTTVFDSNYRSRWKTKVLQILEHTRQPCVTNIAIDWHGNVNDEQETFTSQAPKQIRSLFNGMKLSVYRFISNCHKATLTATINNQEFVTTVFSSRVTESKGLILHCLTARAIIQDYENGLMEKDESENELFKKQHKQDLIELSMKYSVVSSFTSFVAIEERDGQALAPDVRLLDVMLENDVDILPYVSWDGDRSQVDLIKEKLVNAKRLFDSASITAKVDLSNEYEKLCQSISYRSGGDAKYDLMLAILETYRKTDQTPDRVRDLEEQMEKNLVNELKNATGNEKVTLEKRLVETGIRIQNDQMITLEDQDVMLDELAQQIDECWDDDFYGATPTYLCDEVELCAVGSITEYENEDESEDESEDEDQDVGFDEFGGGGGAHYSSKRSRSIVPTVAPKQEMKQMVSESDEDHDMGFGLFDDGGGTYYSSKRSRSLVPAAAPRKEMKPMVSESDEDQDMGFGLFDDSDFVSLPTALSGKEVDLKTEKALEQTPTQLKSTPCSDSILATRTDEPNDASRSSLESSLEMTKELLRKSIANVLERGEKLDSLCASETLAASWNTPSTKQYMHSLQQQQQLTVPSYSYSPTSPSYSPTSPSYSPHTGFSNSSSASNIEPPVSARWAPKVPMSTTNNALFEFFKPPGILPAPAPPARIPPSVTTIVPPHAPTPSQPPNLFGNNGNNVAYHSPPTSNLFGAVTHPPPPPPSMALPPQQQASFSFGFVANQPTTDDRSTEFKSSSIFSSAPSASILQPPPPLPMAQLLQQKEAPSFGFFGNQTNANPLAAQFGSTSVFGGKPTFGSPPAMSFGNGPPAPPPPPPPLPGGFSFGVTTNTVSPVTQSSFATQAISTTATTSASIFGGASTASSPFTFSFGASGASNIPSGTSAAMFANPAVPPPTTSSTPFGSFSSTPTSSSALPLNVSAHDKNKDESHYRDIDYSSARRASDRGGGGKGASSADQRARRVEDDLWSRVESLSTSRKALVHQELADYCLDSDDTQFDEEPRKQTTALPISSFLASDVEVDFLAKRVKKKGKSMRTSHVSEERNAPRDLLLLDVTPLSFGIEDVHGHMCALICRNQTIPTKTPLCPVFTNAYAYQKTATIRVFHGDHKLTKYNNFIGELVLTDLKTNFASQTLEISISMDLDANSLLQIQAEELGSGSKATLTIDSQRYAMSANDIERHVSFVYSDPDYQAPYVARQQRSDALYMLKGETENNKIDFTGESEVSRDFSALEKTKNIELTSTTINELKRIQLSDGSFDLNEDLANLLSINISYFDQLKKYLCKQGFNSFALNIQKEILQLIGTGIILIEMFFQIPALERNTFLVPFDHEQIRSTFHRHLPRPLMETIDRAIQFYKQKRSRYSCYCGQLELKYSTWEKFIQYAIWNISD